MKVEFKQTIDDVIKAHIEFAANKKIYRKFRVYGVPILSLCFFLLLLNIYSFEAKVTINGKSYPYIVCIVSIIFLIPFSILFGWLTYLFLKSTGKRIITDRYNKFPPKAFGRKVIIINDDWLEIEAPLSQNKYKWLMVEPIIETPKFVFITMQGYLLTSIPIGAFGDTKTKDEFVKQCNKFIDLYRK